MKDETQIKILKGCIGVVYTLVAVLCVILIIELNGNTKKIEQNTSKIVETVVTKDEMVKVEVPASVAKESVVEVKITPAKVYDLEMNKKKDYITGLKYYNGNLSFDDVYYESKKWCKEYDINHNFFLALMYVESKYENGAVSKKNCVGLCQLGEDAVDQFNTAMWGTGKYYTLEQVRWDWKKNIEVSCWYLSWLWDYKKSYTNTARKYIQSYNYGRTGVLKAIQNDEFTYADAIIKYRNALNNL